MNGVLRRGVRTAVRWWWQSVRPSTGAVAPSSGPARPSHVAGRSPRPDERWVPTTTATGPWAEVVPEATGHWPRRGTVLVLAGWAAAVTLRVRRDTSGWRTGG